MRRYRKKHKRHVIRSMSLTQKGFEYVTQWDPEAVSIIYSRTNNLDASHGYQLYKMLHDARVRRRKCKNAIAWIDYILEQAPDRFIENDPSPRIVGTRSCDYAPRALPALFEWENEGQTPTANL